MGHRAAIVAGCLVLAALGIGAGEPRIRIDPVDQRRAEASMLTRQHLGADFRRDKLRITVLPMPRCGTYPGSRSDLTVTGDAEAHFSNGYVAVGSIVAVYKTSREREAWWKRVVRPQFARCVGLEFVRHAARGWRAQLLSAKQLPANRTAAQNARFRIVIRYSRGRRSFDAVRDIVVLGNGRAIGRLSTYSIGRPCICTKTLATILAGQMIHARV